MKEVETCKKEAMDTKRKKHKYEKPLFEKQTTMNFPEEIWERHNGGNFQQTCSKCHHCR